jgi:dTDP-4-amino-4,6-dideoxygalactose transaminase
MNNNKIWLSSPHIGNSEFIHVTEAFKTNWIAPLGPFVDQFEENLKTFNSVSAVAALSSGTSAIHLALILLDVQRDDIVLCQSFTFSASANPIVYQGATPVFIDSESDTWNMCPIALEDSIKHFVAIGKKPKAIIPVHLYGMPAKINEIIEISRKYNIPVIEDAAESLGSKYFEKPCGSFGDFGVLSFNGNKIITTSGGGALISNNVKMIDKARFLATQARDNAPYYQHSNIGYNYRLSNVLAAIGVGQLEVIDERILSRRSNFKFYKKELSTIDEISFLEEPSGFFSNRWLTTILIKEKKSITNENIRIALNAENIESRTLWKPMHLQPIFNQCQYFGGTIASKLFENGLCLPSGSNLNLQQLERVVNSIKKVYKK